MDSNHEESEELDFLTQAIVKHSQVVLRFILGLSINLTNWSNIQPEQLSFKESRLMNTETAVFIASILCLILLCHTFESWFSFLTRRLPFKWQITCSSLISSSGTKNGLNSGSNLLIGGVNQVEELKLENIGIYAIQGRRPKMEDKFTYVKDNRSLVEMFAVFDGHGGDSASIFAKSKLGDAILQRLEQYVTSSQLTTIKDDHLSVSYFKHQPNQNYFDQEKCYGNESSNYSQVDINENIISNIINEEILAVDKQLIDEIRKRRDIAGTTALIAIRIIKKNQLVVANVGDSRGVLCDNRGNVIPVSFDHKPQQLKEHRRIKEAGGFISFNGVWRVAGTLATSRALGDYPLKDKNLVIAEPDILTFDLNVVQPRFMLLASDGLWDMFTNEEAVSYVKEALDSMSNKLWGSKDVAFDVAKNLVNEAYKRGSLDNITVILVLFDKTSFIKHTMSISSPSNRFRRKPVRIIKEDSTKL